MVASALTVEVLPAGYGDSILVTTGGRKPWRLLVDTGPDECWPTLAARLALIQPDKTGRRHIDLVVISHVDHDHIGCAGALFSDRTLGLSFSDIWFNAPVMPASKSVGEGQSLAELLGASPASLPWNKAWHGRHAVSSTDSKFVEVPAAAGAPRITLLSPSPASLAQMFKVWDAELARAREREARPAAAAIARGALHLDALARKKTAVDRAPANGSSIAMLLEHQGRSVLLGSDAHPTVFVPALAALAAHRQSALPMQFDVFKLSHHGSRANVTVDLMQAAQAQHYVVSTNGAIFGHPDDEAIARAIVNGGTQRSLWFNYLTKQTEKWTSEELQSQHQYTARFPDPGGAVVISLAPVVRHR